MIIPLIDLKRQYIEIKEQIEPAVLELLASGNYIQGEKVKTFEQNFASYIGSKHAVSVNSGTDALLLALKAAGIKPGDEVITTPFSFIATSEVIVRAGATPVFADISPDTFTISPEEIIKKITTKTRAIIPVHIFGNPCNMDMVQKTAEKYSLIVIEDCAQSAGAVYKGTKTGRIGNIGCYSLFPTKNLGGFGDGGILVTDNAEIAARARKLAGHGAEKKYYYDEIGMNSRLDAVQAVILDIKLKSLDRWNNRRREIAEKYNKAFSGNKYIRTQQTDHDSACVYHQYSVRVLENKRGVLMEELQKRGIQSGIYYPHPLHLQKAHSELGYMPGNLPEAEKLAGEILSLPVFPELAQVEQDKVIASVLEILQ